MANEADILSMPSSVICTITLDDTPSQGPFIGTMASSEFSAIDTELLTSSLQQSGEALECGVPMVFASQQADIPTEASQEREMTADAIEAAKKSKSKASKISANLAKKSKPRSGKGKKSSAKRKKKSAPTKKNAKGDSLTKTKRNTPDESNAENRGGTPEDENQTEEDIINSKAAEDNETNDEEVPQEVPFKKTKSEKPERAKQNENSKRRQPNSEAHKNKNEPPKKKKIMVAAADVKTQTTDAEAPKEKTKTPKVYQMVNNAITSLKKRGGSSLAEIKSFISSRHQVDAEKMTPYIKRYLNMAIAEGSILRISKKPEPSDQKVPRKKNDFFKFQERVDGSLKHAKSDVKEIKKVKGTALKFRFKTMHK